MAIQAKDLSPETRRKLNLPAPRLTRYGKEEIRRHALNVLATISELPQGQRRRVLEHALKVNRV